MNVQTQNRDGTWSDAQPMPAAPRIWTHYYEARNAAGVMVAEGTPPWWYRLWTRLVYGWRWTRV